MNKRKLCSILQSDVHPKRLQETQQMCMALIEEQIKLNLIPEERTNFWQFLSDVMWYTGRRLWIAPLDSTRNCIAISLCLCFFSS